MVFSLYKHVNLMKYLLELLVKGQNVPYVLLELSNIFLTVEIKRAESGVTSLLDDFKEQEGVEIVSKYMSSMSIQDRYLSEQVIKIY